MQKRFYPAELIEMKLQKDFGATFKQLVASYGLLVDDSGRMPKDWKKPKLPMILGKKPAEGSETAAKEGTSTTPATTQQLNSTHQQPAGSPSTSPSMPS